MDKKFKLDCKYFEGNKPCKYNRLCRGCGYYFPTGMRILIVKLDSIGDVLRTTPILRNLKERYPNVHITWITSRRSIDILKGNKYIDRLLSYNLKTIVSMRVENFDFVISLDKDIKAAGLVSLIKSDTKVGYGLGKTGKIFPLNKEAEYEFSLGLSNELKFKKNQKTYQEMIFNIIGANFNGEEYVLDFSNFHKKKLAAFRKTNILNTNDCVIGLNIGCGKVFPGKKWTVDGFCQLASKLINEKNVKVVILAGPNEKSRYQNILNKIDSSVITPGCDNTLEEFISFVGCCDIVVTGDTLGMHIAIALKKKVIALFGPTCSQEVYLYNRGIKIISKSVCVPCYKNECDFNPNCMMNISVDNIYESINKLKE